MASDSTVRSGVAAVVAVLTGLAVSVGATAPARADCGDPGQPACTGPVPTADQVVAALTKLIDPSIPYQDKADVVENGFTPDEGQQLDDELGQLGADGKLPFTFAVTDIEPADDNLAGATVAVTGPKSPYPRRWPIVLVDQGGNWLITHNPSINSEAETMQKLAECHHPGFPVWKRYYCF